MGIDNYYFNNFDGELINSEYWDFHITSDKQGDLLPYLTNCYDGCGNIINDSDLVLWFDINNTGTTLDGSSLTSLVQWSGLTITPSSGITLNDFGLTGIDNGRVSGLTDTLTLTTGDTRVKLYPVTGSTYEYPWSYNSGTTINGGCNMGSTTCLSGGFYQGFFKLDFEKPAPFSSTTVTTNNCGEVTGTTLTKGDPDGQKYDLLPTKFEKGWTMETWILPNECNSTTGTTLNDVYTSNSGFFFYIGVRSENKFQNTFSGESGYTTTTNLPLQPDIVVDEGLNGGKSWFAKSSPRLIGSDSSALDCCCPSHLTTGSTSVTSGTSYNYCSQLAENVLGIRITDDNKIGWRKVTVTGECRNNKFVITGETIEEEYTEGPVILTGNTPSLIQVVYISGGEKLGLPAGNLKIFVNGRLVLKSKEFIGLQLRPLNEWSDKQLGVPYNISWGGGTQGLLESQTFNGPDPEDSGLMLEQNFAGTFLGQLSQLRFYKRPLNVLELRNNLYSECSRYCVRTTFGGNQSIQPGSTFCSDCSSGNLPPYPNC